MPHGLRSGALYRDGRWEEAQATLTKAIHAYDSFPGKRRGTVINARLLLAMATHRIGQVEQARKWLTTAVEHLDSLPSASQSDYGGMSWDRRLTTQLLRQEAEQLLKDDAGTRNDDAEHALKRNDAMTRTNLCASLTTNSFANSLRPAWVIFAGGLLFAATVQQPADAITINMEYTDEGSTPPHPENPTWDPAGVILKAHFQAAKSIWESLLPGGGTYSFDFHWDNDIDGLGLYTPGLDEYIEINPDFNWFADPTPGDSAEFNPGVQTLYGNLPPFSQSTYFPGTAPPGGLEVGFRATGIPGANGAGGFHAGNGFDLLSTVVHEIGHALGISGVEPGEYNIFPQHVGGLNNVLVLEDNDSGHLAGDGAVPFLMCENCGAMGVRRFPTATDVLVIAEDQGITDVLLPRVGRISSGLWSDGGAWIGGDQPVIPQDVYITHGGSVTLDTAAWVVNLLVGSGNTLQVQSQNLRVEGAFTFAGATVSVAAGGSILANNIVGEPSALTTAAGSSVAFNSFTPPSGSTATSANFNGSVAIGYNTGIVSLVTFDPNALATWTIAEQLSIGALLTRTALVIDNGADFTSGSGLVGYQTGQGNVTINGLGSTWTINGPLTANYGSITVNNGGNLTSGNAVLGNDLSTMDVTVDYAVWEVNGNLTVGPATPGGSRRGRVVVREAGQVLVDGDLEIRGATGTLNSEVIVEEQGLLGVDGAISIRMFGAEVSRRHVGEWPNDRQLRQYSRRRDGRSYDFRQLGVREQRDDQKSRRSAFVFFGAAPAGATHFLDNSDAGTANITNRADGTVSTVANGHTVFYGSSNASFATIENEGSPSQSKMPGRTEFRNNSSAANATINNRGHITIGDLAGRTFFYDSATAANATLRTYDGYSDHGRIEFRNQSTAASAQIFIENEPLNSATAGGYLNFFDNSTAAQSEITLRAGTQGTVQFYNNATAANAQIITETGTGNPGNIFFNDNSTAANANISLGESSVMTFYGQSTAANATIAMAKRAQIICYGSAGQAQIVAAGGSTNAAGGQAFIHITGTAATAANSTITVNGATAPTAFPALVQITGTASPGNATLIANSGANGGAGGIIGFNGAANGSTARLVANAGGLVDFLNQASYNDISFGSIEGAGTFHLRGAHVITGSRNTSTTVTGPIVDTLVAPTYTGGRLTKVGTGTLTLAGTNTYTGLTTVNAGAVSVTSSITGGAVVNNGGTLGGTGSVGGLVTANSGAHLAPGTSIGTITMAGGLTTNAGSILDFELGTPTTGDKINVTLAGGLTLNGGTVNLINAGGLGAGAYTLIDYAATLGGAVGNLALGTQPAGFSYSLVNNAGSTSIDLMVSLAGVPGDYNNNGSVDAADYVLWRKGGPLANEVDNPGTVNAHDYTEWRSRFGNSGSGTGSGATGSASASAAVPEPNATTLCVLCALLLARRRTR